MATIVVLAAAGPARAQDLRGPEFGANLFRASVDDVQGEADTDAYEARLVAGERLSLVLNAAAADGLEPRLRLFGPTGEVAAPVEELRDGRRLAMRGFEIPETGRWVVAVDGRNTTQGRYTLRTSVRRAAPLRMRDVAIGGASELVILPFEGLEGARLRLDIVSGADVLASLAALRDPAGDHVPGADGPLAGEARIRRGGRKVLLRRAPLATGDGTYRADVGVASGVAGTFRATIVVRPARRPRGRRRLRADADPFVAPLAQPLGVGEGQIVRVTGANIARTFAAAPTVYLGESLAPVAAVDPDGGSFVDVLVPPPPQIGAVVGVTVVNPDGQAFTRADYVRFEAAGLEDRSAASTPQPSAVDDLSAAQAAIGDVDADGKADDLVIVSPGDPAVTRVDGFLGPGTALVTTPEPGTTTPGEIAVAGEEDVVSFTLAAEDWVEIRCDFPGTLGDAVLTLLGPSAPAAVVATADAFDAGPFERLAARLLAGTWFVRVSGDGDSTGTYALSVTTHPGTFAFPGIERRRTRVLRGKDDGTFEDVTGTALPANGQYGTISRSTFHAGAVTVGDLDGDDAAEIVIAGFSPGYVGDYLAYSNAYRNVVGAVRVLRNDGYGAFSQNVTDLPPGVVDRLEVYGEDERSRPVPLIVGYRPLGGTMAERPPPSALALGDLDGDGDDDVVVAFPEALAARSAVLDFTRVDPTRDPPFVPSSVLDEYGGYFYAFNPVYVAGTQVLENRLDENAGLQYVTGLSLPVGEPPRRGPVLTPGLHARDVALGDLDGDDDLDIVLTWDDPTSVSIYGSLYPQDAPAVAGSDRYGVAFDEPRAATFVLLNDGAGHFTDASGKWLPATTEPEFWQAHRLALHDLDGDDDPDLVLLHRDGLEAYRARALAAMDAPPAAGTTTPGRLATFLEVDRFELDVQERGVYQVRVDLGNLPSVEVALLATDPEETRVGEGFGGFGFPARFVTLLDAGLYAIDVIGPGPPSGMGTYTLQVDRLLPRGDVPHGVHALRVLENRGAQKGFVDVTADVLPPVDAAAESDLRGETLLVTDLNGDASPDLVVGTRERLTDATGTRRSSLRILLGSPSFVFTGASADFLPDPALESGDAGHVLLGDVAGSPSLLLFTESRPEASDAGRYLRVLTPR